MDFITTAQAGEILDVTPRQIRYLLESDQLEGQRVTPRFWLVSRESVEALKAKRQAQEATPWEK